MNQHTAATLTTTAALPLMERATTSYDAADFWHPVGATQLPPALSRVLAAAQRGDAAAQNRLGEAYGNGAGVKRDDRTALMWIRKAAAQGHADALYNLGAVHANGRGGIRQDVVLAYVLFSLAAGGNATAAVQRRYLLPRLSREQFAEAQAMLRDWKLHTALPTRSKTGLLVH